MCLFCYLLRLTFVQVSLVFELEYGYSTNIYIPIKQYKSDHNGLLHFDAIAADE